MPKLLRKDLLEINKILFITVFFLIFSFILEIFIHISIGFFACLNLCFLLMQLSNNRVAEYVLPDYVFVAPVSRLEREKMVNQRIWLKLIMVYIVIGIGIVLGNMPHDIRWQIYYNLLVCGVQLLLFFSIITMDAYGRYMYKNHAKSWWLCFIIIIFINALFAGVSRFDEYAHMYHEPIDYVFLVGIGIVSLGMSIFIIIKYHMRMVHFLADYENTRNVANHK